ncbi:hypothetical protein SAMN04487866_12624 [Thermoactinomyces sp. DSM 45891]|uniref:hypothetical protein n=1 Tax=Thermoactinomyces sp. DSM 45891 TaxID=1761907 RepID=UPI00091DFD8F|nr:hypothetical protein [Thermoactinomyces sp. DSM 45891]SFX79515.1 hypothetical protein SAMN04487866_12624 [Thermoactinomyces sp. DSM 45891]
MSEKKYRLKKAKSGVYTGKVSVNEVLKSAQKSTLAEVSPNELLGFAKKFVLAKKKKPKTEDSVIKQVAIGLLSVVSIILIFMASRISTSYIYEISHFLKWNVPLSYFDPSLTKAIPTIMAMVAVLFTMIYVLFALRKAHPPTLYRIITVAFTILFLIPGVVAFVQNYSSDNLLSPLYKDGVATNKAVLDIRNDTFLVAEHRDGVLLPCFSFVKFDDTTNEGIGPGIKLKPYKQQGSTSTIKCEK